MCLNFVEERTQKCDRENREWRWCQIKSIYRLHLDLVVKQLCYISCLNACATNCSTFRNQKLCCGTVFPALQAFSLRHSIKKACFFIRAKWTCLSREGGESSPPPPAPAPSWLRAWLSNSVTTAKMMKLIVTINSENVRHYLCRVNYLNRENCYLKKVS